jgi:tetratricopeptide (TPR) repeat protein
MDDGDREAWLARVDARILAHSSGPMLIGHELRQIYAVREVRAPEAMILYGGRILEAIAAEALKKSDFKPSSNVCSNLVTLVDYNLLVNKETTYWAHALRRMGNAARHLLTECTVDDGDLALCFAERWLDWFFLKFRFGPRLQQLTLDGEPLDLCGQPELQSLMNHVNEFSMRVARERTVGDLTWLGPFVARSAVVPALAAEICIDCGANDPAIQLLTEALAKHPHDLRLQQLMGLAFSRKRQFDKALEWLEPLLHKNPNDDENSGICAGVYKRLWEERKTHDLLEKAHRIYNRGWGQSQKASAYLGINAATTALYLGHADKARSTAEEVRKLLADRFDRLAKWSGRRDIVPNYWDTVTLAEALLLLGSLELAATYYRDAFTRHGDTQQGSVESTRAQLRSILRAMDVGLDEAAFMALAETT